VFCFARFAQTVLRPGSTIEILKLIFIFFEPWESFVPSRPQRVLEILIGRIPIGLKIKNFKIENLFLARALNCASHH